MKISKELEKALNDQINFEFYSAYIYLGMGGYFNTLNYKGFENWMRVQAQEEMFHAMKLYNYVFDRDGEVTLQDIKAPQKTWESALDAFQNAYEHEQIVTSNFHELTELALKNKDHTTNTFLQWFITEQIEEEANAKGVVDQLKMIGPNNHNAMYMLDRELAQRVYTPPAGAAAN